MTKQELQREISEIIKRINFYRQHPDLPQHRLEALLQELKSAMIGLRGDLS